MPCCPASATPFPGKKNIFPYTPTRLPMGRVIEEAALHNRVRVFQDRREAGAKLAGCIRGQLVFHQPLIVCAIPAGGVPVGLELAEKLPARLMLGIVRKVKIPGNPEAGFGAVTWEGSVLFNEALIRQIGLTRQEIDAAVQETRENIRDRMERFTGGRPLPSLQGTAVMITDDGLASGYTMLAAIRAARNGGAREITVAVPTGSAGAVSLVAAEADLVVCLNQRDRYPFAVADAYRSWYDLDDREVSALIREAGEKDLLWNRKR